MNGWTKSLNAYVKQKSLFDRLAQDTIDPMELFGLARYTRAQIGSLQFSNRDTP